MTTMKDKLSASVKQARTGQTAVSAEATPVAQKSTAAAAPAKAKPVAAAQPKVVPSKVAPKPAPAKAAPKPVAKPATPAAKKSTKNVQTGKNVQPSGSSLFPSRVWPD
jgi:hypothetical protein